MRLIKQSLRRLLLGIAAICRPLRYLADWWLPIRSGPLRNSVVIPDSMAIFFVAIGGIWLPPYVGISWSYVTLYLVALLFSPAVLLTLVRVGGNGVCVYRLVAFIPYWWHQIPHDAKFDLYQAWEDPAPTGVAFEARSYGADPLHLGTSGSAESLFAYLGSLLVAAGWRKVSFGYEHPCRIDSSI